MELHQAASNNGHCSHRQRDGKSKCMIDPAYAGAVGMCMLAATGASTDAGVAADALADESGTSQATQRVRRCSVAIDFLLVQNLTL